MLEHPLTRRMYFHKATNSKDLGGKLVTTHYPFVLLMEYPLDQDNFVNEYVGTWHYSSALFKINNSSCSVILKLVDLILASIGLTEGIMPANFASTITPIVPIIVKPS